MPIRQSHGRPRAETPRPADLPPTAITVPDRDPTTGRFAKGNGAARRRALRRQHAALGSVPLADVQAELRPIVQAARAHCVDLLAELPAQSALVNGVAEELSLMRALYRDAAREWATSSDADVRTKARAEMRALAREVRGHALTLRALGAQVADDARAAAPPPNVFESLGVPMPEHIARSMPPPLKK